MTLAENLADIFKKEMQIIIDQEQEEENYLSSEDFSTNKGRANVGVDKACEQVVNKLAIYICNHRSLSHGEDLTEELQKLESELKPEYKDEVSTQDWWNP